jgi:chromosome segregation ATPase
MLVSITIYKEKIYMKENDNNSLAETLVNYEMLIEMIPELGEVVYTGMVTLDAAKAVFQELSEVNQIDFVESLDCVKRMLQQRDSRIKEMENDIAAKTVVETPADYIPLQKANRDMERQNEFLEARIRKLDKENGQLKRQLAELQRKQDPEQERLKKIHEAVQLFSVKTEIYLKDMDKYAWLLDDLQNIPEEDFKEYVRSIKVVKSWAVSMDQKVDGLMDKVG